jgi:DNA-binding transcriptional LysR family regulator
MDLNALKDFVSVATHGGFGAASRAESTAKASLSRRVRQLEDAIGVRLIERTRTGFRLTAEGVALYERWTPLLADLTHTIEEVRSENAMPQGPLRISAPTVLAHSFLGYLAAGFRARYPAVDLEIVADDRKVDPVLEGFDAVLRANPDPVDELVGRAVLGERLVLVASPGIGRPLPFIGLGGKSGPSSVRIRHGGRIEEVETIVVLRLSSQIMIRDAILAGGGAALLPEFLISSEIASGALVQLGIHDAPEVQVWLLHPGRRPVSARLRAFADFISESFPNRRMP